MFAPRILLLCLLPFLPIKVVNKKDCMVNMEGNTDFGGWSVLQVGIDLIPVVNSILVLVALMVYLVKSLLSAPKQVGTQGEEQTAEASRNRDAGSRGTENPDAVQSQLRCQVNDGRGETNPYFDGQGCRGTELLTPTGSAGARCTTSFPTYLTACPAYQPYPVTQLNAFDGCGRAQNSTQHIPATMPVCHGSCVCSLRKEKHPETFSGTETELKDWLCYFEVIAKHNGWTEEDKGFHLATSLRGKAQQVLQDLPAGEIDKYSSILQALKTRFDPEEQENTKRKEFRSRQKAKEETMTEYGFAISRLAKSAYPKMPDEYREDLAVEQFIEGLPSTGIKKHVLFGRPQSLDSAIKLAVEFESFHGKEKTQESKIPKEADTGTIEDTVASTLMRGIEEIFRRVQHVQGKILELEREKKTEVNPVENEISTPSTFISGLICDNCFAEGHTERQCRNPRAPRPPLRDFLPGVWCHRCKFEGHVKRSCPNPRSPLSPHSYQQ